MPTKHNLNREEDITIQDRQLNINKRRSESTSTSKIRNNRKRQVRKRGETVKGAQSKLQQFKQATILAVAVTGFLLLLVSPGEAGYSQNLTEPLETEEVVEETEAVEDSAVSDPQPDIATAAKDEALFTIKNIWKGFYRNLPKIAVAIVALLLAWLFVRLIKTVLNKWIGHWRNGNAIITLLVISVWLFAIGVAVSVVAGDIRALIGSLGLVGLALSWSLQTPIESFTGWLQNSFQGYYRVGDRVSVGDVFGDVYKIDFLTTTVWEIGGPYRQGFVHAEQPTGRMVTFPNNEILSGTVVNLTRDFSYVWDELAVAVGNESDINLAMTTIEKTAVEFLGKYMEAPAVEYSKILKKANLDYNIAHKPEIYLSLSDSWTDIVVRYLVGARERRTWKSNLINTLTKELNKDEYKGKILPAYPRRQIQIVDAGGAPAIDPFGAKTN